MSHISENLEWARNGTRILAETITYTLSDEFREDGVTAQKHVGDILM